MLMEGAPQRIAELDLEKVRAYLRVNGG
jgi:hypothetical protein